jgi:hypothetical protein
MWSVTEVEDNQVPPTPVPEDLVDDMHLLKRAVQPGSEVNESSVEPEQAMRVVPLALDVLSFAPGHRQPRFVATEPPRRCPLDRVPECVTAETVDRRNRTRPIRHS